MSEQFVVGAVFVSVLFMSIMDTTVVNVAVPTIARQFRAGNSSVQWIATGYLLSLAVWMPASGWISDRFGTKRVLLAAIGVFTIGSMLCAVAGSLAELVGARVIQGIGGGMLQPVGMAMLFRVFPPHQRARASQILIVPTAVAPALGPILGGTLVQHASWRWAFLINLPIGLAALVFGALFLRNQPHTAPGRFDVAGFLLAGTGLPFVLYAVTQGPSKGWGSATIVECAVAGVLLLSALIVVELRVAEPLLDLRLLHNRLFRDCTLVGVVAFGGFLGTLFILPLFLQEASGRSAMTSGLTTFPEALGVLVWIQLAGRLYPKVGPRRLMAGGLVEMSAVIAAMSLLQGSTSLWLIRMGMFAIGGGLSFVIISQQAAAFATISPADTGRGAAISASVTQTAAATGVALLVTVLTARAGHARLPVPSDFHVVFLVAAAMTFAGGLMALRIRDEDAAGTMGGSAPLVEPDPSELNDPAPTL
jgi:EmrB/QacA subfamily drug resistance transporter